MTVFEGAAKLAAQAIRLESERDAAIARAEAAEAEQQVLEDMVDGLIALLREIPITEIWMCGIWTSESDDEKWKKASEKVLAWNATEQISSLFTQEEQP